MNEQVHVFYSGRVQGVGFRFTSESIASELGIKGWVKNLPDGRVEIIAEAEKSALESFLSKINEAFSGYIRGEDTTWQEALGKFNDFRVKF